MPSRISVRRIRMNFVWALLTRLGWRKAWVSGKEPDFWIVSCEVCRESSAIFCGNETPRADGFDVKKPLGRMLDNNCEIALMRPLICWPWQVGQAGRLWTFRSSKMFCEGYIIYIIYIIIYIHSILTIYIHGITIENECESASVWCETSSVG